MFIVAALYHFTPLKSPDAVVGELKELCSQNSIKGTLILAEEGINGTVSGTREAIDVLRSFFESKKILDGMEYKESFCEIQPFYRLKVMHKKEIVTLGIPEVDPREQVGDYVEPHEWNEIIQQEDVLVLDTRNTYETLMGTFQGAVDPQTETFRDFPEYVQKNLSACKDRPIAMFCTGGVRCEKASSYLLKEGFKKVYHLKGGILNYLEKIPPSESLWQGECFIFDQRVGLMHEVKKGNYAPCYGCRMPLSPSDLELESYEKGVSCLHCHESLTAERKERLRQRQRQVELAHRRSQVHIGRSFT